MDTWTRCRWLARLSFLVGLCSALTGCQALFGRNSPSAPPPAPGTHMAQHQPGAPATASRSSAQPVILAPRSEVSWVIESSEQPVPHPDAGRAGPVLMSGQSTIGPDGTLVLGPYGTHRVAGMTLTQAGSTIERQLQGNLRQPRVKLQIPMTAQQPLPLATGPVGAVRTSTQLIPGRPAEKPTIWQTPGPADWRGRVVVPMVWTSPGEGGKVIPASATQGPRPLLLNVPAETTPVLEQLPPVEVKQAPTSEASLPATGTQQVGGLLYRWHHHPHQHQHHHASHHGSPAPREDARISLPTYVIAVPDILQVDSLKGLLNQPVQGPHLVRPDGTIGLGSYGSVYVAGLTLEDAKREIARVIHARLDPRVVRLQDVIEGLSVDVLAYNSRVYYVITDGGGIGEQITRLPITGNETVLDALALNPVRGGGINGLGPVASKHHIWVARPSAGGHDRILPVDYIGITQRGDPTSNWQLLPGDRVYVKADVLRTLNVVLDKLLSPVERILGVTLLGSQTVNSIRSGSSGGQ